MIFSSYKFIFAFLPIVISVHYVLCGIRHSSYVKAWMVTASLLFYGMGQLDFFITFIFFILSNYILAYGLSHTKNTWIRILLLAITVSGDIGLLVYYKYLNFIFECVGLISHTNFIARNLTLPIGISFFTFQTLAYVISVYQNKPLVSLLDYCVFVTFFPQLIVGPVVKMEEIYPQIKRDQLLRFDSVNIYRGTMLFSVGCAKKILLADPMTSFASAFYNGDVQQASMLVSWAGVLAFTFAYYFDFSGYIDMARGIGHLFGIELPINFNSPYKARNFAEFWRSWNITISRFFNDAVFSNLFHFGDRIGKLVFATLATFIVSGLWHGADWHYILWGIANGVFVCFANIMTLYRKSLPKTLAVFLTFWMSALIRVLFDCKGLTQAAVIYKNLFHWTQPSEWVSEFSEFITQNWYFALVMLIGSLICFLCKNSNSISKRTDFCKKDAAFSAVLLMLSVFSMSKVSTFLYFNF